MELYTYTLSVKDGENFYYRIYYVLADDQDQAIDWANQRAQKLWREEATYDEGRAVWVGPGGETSWVSYLQVVSSMAVPVYPGDRVRRVDLVPIGETAVRPGARECPNARMGSI